MWPAAIFERIIISSQHPRGPRLAATKKVYLIFFFLKNQGFIERQYYSVVQGFDLRHKVLLSIIYCIIKIYINI